MFEKRKLKRQKILLELDQIKKQRELIESVPQFARDIDEDSWVNLGEDNQIYTEDSIKTMQEQATKLYYTNPIAKGLIETIVNFVVGKTCKITSLDEKNNELIQEYWDKWAETEKFDMKSKEIVRRTLRDGEMFLRFIEKGEAVRIRFIEPKEIIDSKNRFSYGIETELDDVETVLNYHRTYNVNGTPEGEEIPESEIIHAKINVDSNVKRGISFLVGIGAYLVKYKNWLDDRVDINRLRAFFTIIGTPTGGTSSTNLKSQFADASSKSGSVAAGGMSKKAIPSRGKVMLSKGVDWELKNFKMGAGDAGNDGRAIRLMIVAGTGMSESTVTGDASNANLASSLVAESPMLKSFESWQDFFEKIFQQIYRKVIEYAIETNKLPQNIDTKCDVGFPILVQRDIKKETEALALQQTSGFVDTETASTKLGYDYKVVKERLDKTNKENEKKERDWEMGRKEKGEGE